MKIILSVLFLFTGLCFAYAMPGSSSFFDWVAVPEISEPALVNPAGLAEITDMELSVSFSTSDSAFEGFEKVRLQNGFLGNGFGFSGWWNDDLNLRRFTTGLGFNLMREGASFGISYSWFDPMVNNSSWEDKDFISLGFLYRPSSLFSFGLSRRGGVSIAGEEFGPVYCAGVAVRPLFSDKLTLTANGFIEREWDNKDYSIGIEFKPLDGLAIRGDYNGDQFNAGIGIDFGHIGIAFAGSGDEDDLYNNGQCEIHLRSTPVQSLIGSGGRFVRLIPGTTGEERTRRFLQSGKPGFTETALLIRRMTDDPSVDGFIVEITKGVGSAAQAEELRSLLEEAKQNGKKVFCYLQSYGNLPYYVASVGNSVYIHPSSGIMFPGLRSHGFFIKEMLDSLGIYPDLLHIGDYKSASDIFTRYDMSEAQREASTALLESAQGEIIRAVAESRGMSLQEVEGFIETAHFTADQAVENGLVDGIAYADEIENIIQENISGSFNIISADQYAMSLPTEDEWGPEPHVGVVVATGTILCGESGHNFFLGKTMGSETIVEALEAAASAPGAVAVLLRIDSGGGDGLASDEMLHAIYSISSRIPVIVSMGGVAASGGYYMACGADRIFADHLTVTGSIGVITGKFSIAELLDNSGINVETVTLTPRADMGTVFRPYTDDERELMEFMILDFYEDFVEKVAEGRGMEFSDVDQIARGRVWSGSDALEIGLVDEIGGIVDAIEYAWQEGGMSADRFPSIRIYPQQSGIFGNIGFPIGLNSAPVSFDDFTLPWAEGTILYLMAPFTFE